MPGCPACGRPVAVARARCLYCGAALPEALVPAAAAIPPAGPAEDQATGPERSLVVLDLTGVEARSLAALTGQSIYDASQRVRRGGLQLHRVLEPAAAEALAGRFRAAALTTYVVPEREVRQRPLCASRGERAGSELLLHTPEGHLVVRAVDLLLVVAGPIAREPGPRFERRRIETARLQESWCAHLHRIGAERPLELDPRRIELGFTVTGSAQLELESWIEALGPAVPRDEGFRRETPAVAPPAPEDEGRSAGWPLAHSHANASLGSRSKDAPPPVYDNLAQFRFYSGWRAAVERRLPGSRALHGAC